MRVIGMKSSGGDISEDEDRNWYNLANRYPATLFFSLLLSVYLFPSQRRTWLSSWSRGLKDKKRKKGINLQFTVIYWETFKEPKCIESHIMYAEWHQRAESRDIFVEKRGRFTVFCPLERHPGGHFVTLSPLEGYPGELCFIRHRGITEGTACFCF